MHSVELNYLLIGILLPNNILGWAANHISKRMKRLHKAIKVARQL